LFATDSEKFNVRATEFMGLKRIQVEVMGAFEIEPGSGILRAEAHLVIELAEQ
jgi:hypothetical protein